MRAAAAPVLQAASTERCEMDVVMSLAPFHAELGVDRKMPEKPHPLMSAVAPTEI